MFYECNKKTKNIKKHKSLIKLHCKFSGFSTGRGGICGTEAPQF